LFTILEFALSGLEQLHAFEQLRAPHERFLNGAGALRLCDHQLLVQFPVVSLLSIQAVLTDSQFVVKLIEANLEML